MPNQKGTGTASAKKPGEPAVARAQAITDVVKAAHAQLTEQERATLEQIRARVSSKLTAQQLAVADGCGCIFW